MTVLGRSRLLGILSICGNAMFGSAISLRQNLYIRGDSRFSSCHFLNVGSSVSLR
jgi:hypothetical protein